MSDTPWTPGPWWVHGATVWAGPEDNPHAIVPPDDMRPEEQRVEDARLIVEAPEMARLLAMFHTRKPDGQPTTWAPADEVAALLARINGT
jgi:hypothetical protein